LHLFLGAAVASRVSAAALQPSLAGGHSNLLNQVIPQLNPQTVPQRLRFTHITTDQGLAANQVQPVLQDRSGFLWFGTYNGLTRYDGINTVVYRNNPDDPNSLSGNLVYALLEDREGLLWVGTGDGLNAFDPKTGHFTRYEHNPTDPHSLISNSVRAIMEDRQGVLWIGTEAGGLDRFDRASGTFTVYQHDASNRQSLAENDVYALHEDRAGNFWVVTYGGLDLFDPAKGTFTLYKNDPSNPRSLSSNNSWKIMEDHTGALWVGTWGGGVDCFDPKTGIFTTYRHDPNNPQSLSNDQVESLYEDPAGEIWVGTNEGGLNVLDPSGQGFTIARNDPTDPESLSDNRVADIYGDRTGLIWIATQGGGVDVYNPQQQVFSSYRHDPGNPNSLSSDNTTTAYEDKGGILWVGTVDQGLDSFDRRTGQIVHYPGTPTGAKSSGFPLITSVQHNPTDPSGVLWLGTQGGLYRFDPATKTYTGYRHDAVNPNSLSDDTIFGMQFDRSGILWIATDGGGLDRFDPATSAFTIYRHDPHNPHTITGDNLLALIVDHAGIVWAASLTGLNRFDPATGQATGYMHDPHNPASLTDSVVWSIHEDRTGVLWAGTGDGVLHRFDPATGSFTHYRDASYVNAGAILGILEDQAGGPGQQGNLWAIRAAGPFSELTPGGQALNAFDDADGLPNTLFRQGAIAITDGVFVLGSGDGLVMFNPAWLKAHTDPPQVALTGFLLSNQPVNVGNGSPLTQAVNETQQITLSYDDRVISFQMAALDYRDPDKNRYQYMLQGFDPTWTEVDSTRTLVTYTNLDPGTYIFRFTASNADGVWNPTGRAVTLIITPPWWQTLWFRALLAVLFFGAVVALYRLRVRSLHAQRLGLERGIAQRTADLAEANSELRQRVGELSALNQTAQALTEWTELPAALQSVGTIIAGLFYGVVGIWLLDDKRLSLTRLIGATSEKTCTDKDALSLSDDPMTKNVIDKAGTAVFGQQDELPAIAQPPHIPAQDSAGGVMLVPMTSRGGIIGLLCVRGASADRAFTPSDMALAQTVSSTLANAIENSQLFAQAQTAAAEEERQRIARELHDSVSQALYAASLAADVLPDLWEQNPERGSKALEVIRKLTHAAVAEMRMLLVELRPVALVNSSLVDLLQTLSAAIDARNDTSVETHLDAPPRLPPDVQIGLYRIAQEALNNVVKHAGAQHVNIALKVAPPYLDGAAPAEWHGQIALTVADDGRGFDPSQAPSGRLGIGDMRERAAEIGAALAITSQPGDGTQVMVTWSGDGISHDGEE
jgi:signal transduction histidine kinase/ligand-binding sensor domain-containing protein